MGRFPAKLSPPNPPITCINNYHVTPPNERIQVVAISLNIHPARHSPLHSNLFQSAGEGFGQINSS